MSMINDALKRAKKAQQDNPPPVPPLEFKPVEPTQDGHTRTPLLIAVAAGLAVVMTVFGGLLIWAVSQQRAGVLQAQARAAVPTPEPAEAVAPAVSPEAAPTNALPAEIVEAPKPELKLQGILFNPRSPCAVVDGRTIYVHDRVGGFRVLAITPSTVTLADASQTNVLSLSP